jgi:hypothetical protein
MYSNEHIDLWNLTPGKVIQNGAQDIFNIVGRLKKPQQVRQLLYSLNGNAEVPVFFNAMNGNSGRLEKQGDFNIDTINSSDLQDVNHVLFKIIYDDDLIIQTDLVFNKKTFAKSKPGFQLNLTGVDCVEEVGQVVDGKWRFEQDEQGNPCLEIKEEDTGLDRIILFGDKNWQTGYEVKTRIVVRKWMAYPHNVGLLFKWNHHFQGDGKFLPSRWSTGLAYYYSDCPGLRVRFGVDVRLDKNGTKLGDFILKEKTLSPWRRWIGWIARNIYRLTRKELIYSQIKPNVAYNFHAFIHPDKYTLTVWQEGKIKPNPQIVIINPPEKLKSGSVGIIAHRCALRVYDFSVAAI